MTFDSVNCIDQIFPCNVQLSKRLLAKSWSSYLTPFSVLLMKPAEASLLSVWWFLRCSFCSCSIWCKAKKERQGLHWKIKKSVQEIRIIWFWLSMQGDKSVRGFTCHAYYIQEKLIIAELQKCFVLSLLAEVEGVFTSSRVESDEKWSSSDLHLSLHFGCHSCSHPTQEHDLHGLPVAPSDEEFHLPVK